MTREEAIKGWIIPALKNTWNDKKNAEILKALKQEPCEDAISRQAAIGIIQNWLNFDTGYSVGEKNVMKCAINELMDLPSVSTEKTGHWKAGTFADYYTYICSECNNSLFTEYAFCPYCGAKMEVVECDDAISRQREKNISKGFEDFMIKSLRKQAGK